MHIRARAATVTFVTTVALGVGRAVANDSGNAEEPVLRVAFSAREGPHTHHSTLVYWGGFHPKAMSYEPLARVGPGGELVPGLIDSWTRSADGRTFTLHVRDGVTAHDGETLDAAGVRDHLLRWRGNPGNRWIGSTDRMLDVRAADASTVVVTLGEPWNLLREAAICNPGRVMAPGAFDHEGTFRAAVGTGPFRLVAHEPGKSFLFEAHGQWWGGTPGVSRVEGRVLARGAREGDEQVLLLLDGRVDLIADGETPSIPRESLERIQRRGFRVWRGPGSSVHYLRLNTRTGPLADRNLRRHLAATVDRANLVAEGELGYAEATTTIFRGGFAGWPASGSAAAPDTAPPSVPVRLRFLLSPTASPRIERHAALLASRARARNLELVVEIPATPEAMDARVKAGEWDLTLGATHGTPYDPWVSMLLLFFNDPAVTPRTASRRPPIWEDARMRALIREAHATPEEAVPAVFARMQALLDEEVPVVPLFINDRIAASVPGLEGLEFGTDAFDLGLARVRLRAGTDGTSAPAGR